jgi:hypothetical protein
VALQRKKLKSGDTAAPSALRQNPGKPEKVLLFKAVRGVQTLYMTSRMQINGKPVMANGRALRLLGV